MKKAIVFFISMFMFATLSFTALASDKELGNISSSKSFDKFNNYISELFNSNESHPYMLNENRKIVTYRFFDKNGYDITDEFISDISNKSSATQYELFRQKVAHAIKRIEIVTRSGDLSKTVEEDIYHNCTAITIEGARWDQIASSALTGEVYYRLRGSITYDPNTYKITSATPALRVDIDWIDWDADTRPFTKNEVSETPIISSNGYSATFNHSISVFANHGGYDMDYVLLGYGTFTDSFQISAN